MCSACIRKTAASHQICCYTPSLPRDRENGEKKRHTHDCADQKTAGDDDKVHHAATRGIDAEHAQKGIWHGRKMSEAKQASAGANNNRRAPATKTTTTTTAPRSNFAGWFQPVTTSQGGDAMDLHATGPRGLLTEAEKKRRKDNNLCNYCASDKHFRAECPVAPANIMRMAAMDDPASEPGGVRITELAENE
ncbi:unnamed protein product [Zymoseptoria tritici ST99CH_1A5]|uniref:CCHC-type domain-containing protein n=1 Tax=Zymoseptoria tritici ST99CH_1A5 TaxID=1276529 RepID=A0A1Y6M2U2_ZYMTR|nr:unnamed protein product [Zymoseptoria tritici ST99CH_3D1]SMY30060.1 unnamed protein product [Zymoseptoria tritici ST99CH_1A5]